MSVEKFSSARLAALRVWVSMSARVIVVQGK
jgi:hypothetical protein